jgi:exosortase C (VPDSG-CTERM-specific)
MNKLEPIHVPADTSAPPGESRAARPALIVALLAVGAAFAVPLYRLGIFAATSSLYSHILLMPVVSAYLIWQAKPRLIRRTPPARRIAASLLFSGGLVFAVYLFVLASGARLPLEDQLALSTAAFLLIAGGTAAWFLGRALLASLLFPLGLLIFLIPIPTAAMAGLELFMQHGSAAVARVFFAVNGTPAFYQNLNFQIPGINLHVAPECSGLRSTLALFILSLVTGHLFLRSRVSRTVLVLVVLPLALIRNGFRIFTIGELCVRYGPHMIDSFVHRRAGPIFFGLSLIPFFFLAVWLQRRERGTPPASVGGVTL